MHKLSLPEKLRAVILDMDGVLVDTEPLHIESFCLLMDEMGIDYELEYVHGFIGYSIADNMRRINKDFFPRSELDIDKCVEKRDQLYLDLIRSRSLQPIAGIVELIAHCGKTNIQLALASSSDRVQVDMIFDNLKQSGFDLRPHFEAVVSGSDVERRKPHPDIYRLALERLGCSANEALAVEDSPVGVQSALEAGLYCAAISSPYIAKEELGNAHAIFDSLKNFSENFGRQG